MRSPIPEFQRLFVVCPQAAADGHDGPGSAVGSAASLIGADGSVRAMVLEIVRPPEWDLLARVWQGVQSELGLPAPAIAVSGTDGLQLWFCVDVPVQAAQAGQFLDGLRRRFLADVAALRLRLLPDVAQPVPRHAGIVPSLQDDGNWSAFVAPDLAPVFAETPWLDVPPSEEGQANLLRSIIPMTRPAFDAALQNLAAQTAELPRNARHVGEAPSHDGRHGTRRHAAADAHDPASSPSPSAAAGATGPGGVGGGRDAAAAEAVAFLLQIMRDEAAPLALRVDAAKTLLQPSSGR